MRVRSRQVGFFVAFTCMCGMLAICPAVGAANYVVTDLGTLGGDSSSATDVNGAGQVVGAARTAEGRDHAFLWQNGVMTDLGTFGGTNSHAAAINESGQVVGWAETADGLARACLFGLTSHVDLSGGHPKPSSAGDINDQGRVVGWLEGFPLAGEDHRVFAVLFQPGTPKFKVLSVLNGFTLYGHATAINNDALIGGWAGAIAWLWSPHDLAAFWDGFNGATTYLGGMDSHVRGVNAGGQFVGESGTDYAWQRAMHWFGLSAQNLGSLALGSSTAAAINNRGQIVGSSEAYRFGLITNFFPGIIIPGADTNGPPPAPQVYEGYTLTRHAFLWRNGVMVDLNDLIPASSGWELTEATSVNDAGQIVGTGTHQGQTRAFLLTPTANPNQIPFIRVRSPLDGEWVNGTRVEFDAEAYDSDGTIQQVEFFARRVTKRDPFMGGFVMEYLVFSLIGSTHPPGYLGTARRGSVCFVLSVSNLAFGNYLILAKATDNQGATACAAEMLLRVNVQPTLSLYRRPFVVGFPPTPLDGSLAFQLQNANEEMTYDVEASTDLIRWSKVGSIDLSPYSLNNLFRISDRTNSPQEFYRAVAR